MTYLLRKFKSTYLITLFILFNGQACANPIIDEYKLTVTTYNNAISEQEYEQSYKLAEHLLAMDPSDTMSLLRLVYSSKMLNKKDKGLIEEYLRGVSNSSSQEQALIELIGAIQTSKN